MNTESTKILPITEKQLDKLKELFSQKYLFKDGPKRQEYFGQLTTDDIQILYKQERKKEYSFRRSSDFLIFISVFEEVKMIHKEFHSEGIPVMALAHVSTFRECPLTTKRLTVQATYYISCKMLNEIEIIMSSEG